MTRIVVVLSILGVLAAAAAGAGAGVGLGDRASEPGTQTLSVLDPALAPDDGPALRSRGGFTGFEGAPALTGRIYRIGTFEALADGAAHIDSPAGALDVQLDTTTRLLRLQPAGTPLAPGDIVLIRLDGDEPTGVLRVPADLREAGGG